MVPKLYLTFASSCCGCCCWWCYCLTVMIALGVICFAFLLFFLLVPGKIHILSLAVVFTSCWWPWPWDWALLSPKDSGANIRCRYMYRSANTQCAFLMGIAVQPQPTRTRTSSELKKDNFEEGFQKSPLLYCNTISLLSLLDMYHASVLFPHQHTVAGLPTLAH